MSADRRQFPRIADDSSLVVRLVDRKDDFTEPGLTTNISGGGIAFRHRVRPEMHALLALEMELPGFPAHVIALARVVWVDDRDYGWFEVGAEFHWIGWDSGAAQRQIADYIRTRLNDPE